MLDKSVVEKLLSNTPLALVIIGVLLFVIGAAGGLPRFSIHVAESGWRIALAILGLVLIAAGYLVWKDMKKAKEARETDKKLPTDTSDDLPLHEDKEETAMTLEEFLEKNSPEDLRIKIAIPQGFNMLGPNRFLKFSNWLSNPIGKGDDPGVNEYPIKGEVIPHVSGLVVEIKIHTNRWYPQSKCFVQSDGTFSGSVWLHRSYPSATFRFDILSIVDGRRLNRFDVYVS